MTYKLVKDPFDSSKEAQFIIRKSDSAMIPKVNENKDYDEYLKWVDAGNTPEAAD